MMRLVCFLSLLLVSTWACSLTGPAAPVQASVTESAALPSPEGQAPTASAPAALENSALVDVYDPARDPAKDLQQAMAIAQRENKRILLELGGDWCIWCKYMDDFYKAHNDLLQFRAENYVLVKVNVSPENMNEGFLAQFPEPAGYPHIYILDRDGTFLHSQDTVELEDGNVSYVPDVFMAFLQEWAPPK